MGGDRAPAPAPPARRIALISAEYPPAPGGVGDYTACLALALARAGREVHVLTGVRGRGGDAAPTGRGEDAAPTAGPAPTAAGRGADAAPTAAGRGADAAPAEPATGPSVHRVVRDWGWGCWDTVGRALGALQPTIAHIQYQTGAYRLHGAINWLPWRLRALPLAWVTTFHDLREPYLFPKAGALRGRANRALMRSSQGLVVTNPQDEAALPAWARARAAGIPIGANLAAQPPPGWDRGAWRAAHGIPPRACLIAYFGFFNASKGLDVLLAALVALRRAGADYRLLLTGGGTGASDPTNAATAAALRHQITDLQLAPAVHWTGYLPAAEVSAALLSADVAALPFHDGASLRRGSLLAVLAHGLPTVTTTPAPALGGGPAWPALCAGANVLLVPPGDAAALAAALACLAADAALQTRLAHGARALLAAFAWERIAAQHLALYDAVGSER